MNKNMGKEFLNPKNLFNSKQYGFSQIAVSDGGKHVFISGQVAWDENENIVGKNNLEIQTRKSIENLKIALEAVGGTLKDVVMLRIYKVKMKDGDAPIISKVLIENFGTENPPPSTWLSVDRLGNADFLIEIEAQAII